MINSSCIGILLNMIGAKMEFKVKDFILHDALTVHSKVDTYSLSLCT